MHKFRQRNQPQARQMLQPDLPFGRLVGPLAAALQMLDQSAPNISIDLTVGAGGVSEGEIVRPSFQVPIQLANQDRNWFEALMTIRHLVQLLPLPLDGLLRRKHIQVSPAASFQITVVPECEAQKV